MTSNVTLYAKWTINTYTVTFNSQGGTAVDSQTVEHGGLVSEPTAPTWTGHTFGGWYKESGCTNAWVFATDTVTSDVTLYAKWTINTYTVTFNKNGGDTEANPKTKTATYGGNVGTLPTAPTRTGYTFTSWNTKANGSGTKFKATTAVTADITVYAQWTPLYALRDTGPAGGLIFYVKEGGYSEGWMYLEAAPSYQGTGAEWGSYGTLIGATGMGIGTGQSNTTTIVTWLNNNTDDTYGDVTNKTDRAAYLCDALTEGGYSNWFLPSKDELNLMYENLKVAGVGGFADLFYWSSSEYDANYAWSQYFSYDSQDDFYKFHTFRVRAVRAF